MSTLRDPRIDPRPGDVVGDRVVKAVSMEYDSIRRRIRWNHWDGTFVYECEMRAWRRFAKNAEVKVTAA